MGAARAPDGIVERSWRAAMAERTPATFEERFVWAARRAAVVGVLAAAVVWGGVLWREPAALSSSSSSSEVALPPDAIEMAMSLWVDPVTAEVHDDDQ
jgi:hypothetical protein